MSEVKIPNGQQAVMPYLMLEDAFKFKNFVIAVFDGKITSEHKQPDSQNIKHAEVEISGSTIMFCDSQKDWPAHPANVFVYVHNADATYAKALKQGAASVMEPADQDYGRSCGVTDPCGNVWWITSIS